MKEGQVRAEFGLLATVPAERDAESSPGIPLVTATRRNLPQRIKEQPIPAILPSCLSQAKKNLFLMQWQSPCMIDFSFQRSTSSLPAPPCHSLDSSTVSKRAWQSWTQGSWRVERGIRCHHICVKRSKHKGERKKGKVPSAGFSSPRPHWACSGGGKKHLTSKHCSLIYTCQRCKGWEREGGNNRRKRNRRGDLLPCSLSSLLMSPPGKT